MSIIWYKFSLVKELNIIISSSLFINSDLQLLESYNATIKDLCNLYGVPVQLLNITESTTYDNYRIARKVLFTNADKKVEERGV